MTGSAGSILLLLLPLLLIGLSYFGNIRAISNEEFLTLTFSQKEKLDKFAARAKPIVTQEYMLREVYLIRWLREANFDVAKAEEMLKRNLKWRAENDMDTILQKSNYTELDSVFTTDLAGCDKEGMPIAVVHAKDWDIRKIIVKYGLEKLLKYGDKVVEEITDMERRMEESGQNVTQFSVIIDGNGFNFVQHACPQCIAFGLRLAVRLQYNYPGYVHKVVFINTPQIALPLWDVAKGVVSGSLLSAVEIFGKNKKVWQKALQKWVDPSQLTIPLGGLRERGLDLNEIRLSGEVVSCTTERWKEVDNFTL